MIFVRLAIGRRVSGSFANSTWPVSRSARIGAGRGQIGRHRRIGRRVERLRER